MVQGGVPAGPNPERFIALPASSNLGKFLGCSLFGPPNLTRPLP